ncbi:single-stranded DNA-binding protein 1-like isoform X2 [Uranotaenia lowii]|uniref:single-stranded DNA-binding protein 1-like isoform X2 n=1 Tax=Uranotaenia lowii TaxID=190385 RepID=UPI00247AAD93|nr:single-stranded DNA-binding protein 1-like isoform X2 [Uranotaenia lowii]XP_055602605.1 single-stranded DNA-binding protein 1-like isoform X2 [Uranotaenia lowii]XP_055602606.1 single-stranded DNA-binding protein 1-like isoform X2 [Uranotaenia lowii]
MQTQQGPIESSEGRSVIRFDTGLNTGKPPHINIDPKGFPNKANPHINVSKDVVSGAQVASKVLKYAGITLTVVAVVIDTWRIGSAFKDDLYIRDNASAIIAELQEAIEKLKISLKSSNSAAERKEIRETLEHLETVLRDVKRTRKALVKTIKTAASASGSWGGGFAGGAGGAWGGAQAGAAIGAVFGPVGIVVGGPVGAVVGAIVGGITGGIIGSKAVETIADAGLSLAD